MGGRGKHAEEMAVFFEGSEAEGGREGGGEAGRVGGKGGREGGKGGGRDVPLHGFGCHNFAPEEGHLTLAENRVGGQAEGGREGCWVTKRGGGREGCG